MHHGSDEPKDDVIRKAAEALRLGATGRFPEGQLDPSDEGEIRIGIAHLDGKVVLNFGKPVAWFALTPRQARQLAESIRKRSYEAEGK